MNRLLRFVFLAGLLQSGIPPAHACNIPVFRYALERWQADACQLVVFTHGEPSTDVLSQIEELNRLILDEQRSINLDVVISTGSADEDPDLASLRKLIIQGDPVQHSALALLRSPPMHGERKTLWQGELKEFRAADWFESPLRTKLIERLLSGDSGVWLFFPGKDQTRNRELVELLERELDRLGDSLPFPNGVGEPGSELYSEIPFTIRFALLEASADEEQSLLRILGAVTNVQKIGDEAFVVPVYGRGRALEAFGQEMITPGLIEEVCQFLTGACSCQVKQSNPGFDLPLAVNWMPRLFGDLLPPEDLLKTPEPQAGDKPTYVPIPSGQFTAIAASPLESEPHQPPVQDVSRNPESTPPAPADVDNSNRASDQQPASAEPLGGFSIEVIQEPGEAVAVQQEAEFPVARWVALGIIALGAVLLIASTRNSPRKN